MLEKSNLVNTYNLISSATTSVISSDDNKTSNNLARSLCCIYYENAQYYSPKNTDKITTVVKELLEQFELENHNKMGLLILNFSQITNKFDCKKCADMLSEINDLAVKQNFKSIVLLNSSDFSLLSKAYLNLTLKQKQQILMLTMNAEHTIKLTVETGNQTGKRIFYELDSDTELLKEIN